MVHVLHVLLRSSDGVMLHTTINGKESYCIYATTWYCDLCDNGGGGGGDDMAL